MPLSTLGNRLLAAPKKHGKVMPPSSILTIVPIEGFIVDRVGSGR
jgi:hypothetical protein